MELKELTEKTLELFNANGTDELGDKLRQACLNNDIDIFRKFKNIVQDLTIDWLQKIFQYYNADRKEKMQDYTPTSLGKLIAELSKSDEETTVIDMCAGSGALTIQKWVSNPTLKFICYEYDEKVIPYLLFNIMLRNIDAIVYRKDVLADEVFEKYEVMKGIEFGEIKCNK